MNCSISMKVTSPVAKIEKFTTEECVDKCVDTCITQCAKSDKSTTHCVQNCHTPMRCELQQTEGSRVHACGATSASKDIVCFSSAVEIILEMDVMRRTGHVSVIVDCKE